jgi:hypothetical protein
MNRGTVAALCVAAVASLGAAITAIASTATGPAPVAAAAHQAPGPVVATDAEWLRSLPRPDNNAAQDAVIFVHTETIANGKTWRVYSYANAGGDLCVAVEMPGEGTGRGCQPKRAWFEGGTLYTQVIRGQSQGGNAATWSVMAVQGMVAGTAPAVELQMTDCSTKLVPTDSVGFFLTVLTEQDIDSGAWPYAVVATAADGQPVSERELLNVEAPDSAAAIAAGAKTPEVRPACA